MSEDAALAVIRLLAEEDGQSLPRIAKRIGLSASELRRVLAALGDDPRFDGLGLVALSLTERRASPARAQPRTDSRTQMQTRAYLTARGRALCAGEAHANAGHQHAPAARRDDA
jgi:IclR helix-turn-helix domain